MADWDIPAVPIEQAQELFVTLGKALRAFQLYDENNPVYQRFVNNLRGAFQELWDETDELRVQVEEYRVLWFDEVVYENTTRSESLAFLFFKDGVREIQFLPGIEARELERLLRLLQRARNLRPEGEDLLTILWDEDLQYFQYRYVDVLAEGVDVPEPDGDVGDLAAVWTAEAGSLEDEGPEGEPVRPGQAAEPAEEVHKPKISRDDFNPTLYSLDPSEALKLQKELEREMERDLRHDVLTALFDRIEDPRRPERHAQILGIFRSLLPNLLGHGALTSATEILAQLHALHGRPDLLSAENLASADGILDDISASDAMEELVRSLLEGTITPSATELGGFLRQLRAGALEPLLRASQHTDDRRIQTALLDAVAAIGENDPSAIVGLFKSTDATVLAGACQLAGRMGLSEAGPQLGQLMTNGDAGVRLAAVEASVELKASTAAAGLERALTDSEREIRIAAAKGLTELRYAPAAARVKQIVTGRQLKHADVSEKIAFFEAFGTLGGEDAVKFLGRILNKKGLFGKAPEEIRACAALGLGRAGTPSAVAALRAAHSAKEPVVKSAVSRALRKDYDDND